MAAVIECPRCHRTSGPGDCCRDLPPSELRVEEALSRARGLAAEVKKLKKQAHAIHVAWQKEIENRIHGEGLRAKIREDEALLGKALRALPNNDWSGNPYREIAEALKRRAIP